MATLSVMPKLETEHFVEILEDARKRLDSAEGEMIIDFSTVSRISPAAIGTLEELARLADAKAVRLVMRGVGVEVYKVLKLMKVASRFSYLN